MCIRALLYLVRITPLSFLVLNHKTWLYVEGAIAQIDSLPRFIRSIAMSLFNLAGDTPDVGARTSLFAATSPLVRKMPASYMGAYLLPPGKISPLTTSLAKSSQLAQDLWELAEKLKDDCQALA